MIDLGTLGGYSFAVALSGRGHIVGYSNPAGNFTDHALSWMPAGGGIHLGGPDISTFSVGVNSPALGPRYCTRNAAQHSISLTPGGGVGRFCTHRRALCLLYLL